MKVVMRGEVDCPFRYPNLDTSRRADASAGPLQGAMRVAGEERTRAATLAAVNPFLKKGGGIEIQPRAFT